MKNTILTAVAGVGLAFSAATSPAANVLFLSVDDLKPTLGCYGDTIALTPHLDALASRAVVFQNAQCQQAVCGPSRASLLTGLGPDTTKVWDLQTRIRDILPDVTTLPQHFKENGYSSVGMGKVFDGRSADGWAVQDAISWTSFVHVPDSKYVDALPDGESPSTQRHTAPESDHGDANIATEAIAQLEALANAGDPFFLAVGFRKPHLPFTAPADYWDLYDRNDFTVHPYQEDPVGSPSYATHIGFELRNGYTDIPTSGPIDEAKQLELIHGYYACVSFIDAQIGRVLQRLDELDLSDDTIIVLWGDHGFHLGDHAMWAKHSNFEQATRAPLIIAAPGVTDAGGAAMGPVDLLDIYPTLLDLTSLPAPANQTLEGISLLPMLSDPSVSLKCAARSQYPRTSGGQPLMGYSYRTEHHRYVQWIAKDFQAGETTGPIFGEELYDYQLDPNETVNRIDDPDYAETAQWFRNYAEAGECLNAAALEYWHVY